MKARLQAFRNKFASLPEQGSAEWIKGRIGCLGGSDLATYLNVNSYKSISDALKEKTGLAELPNPYDPNFLWGHFWEPIHREILEKKFNTTIYEMGAIPYGDSGYESRYKNSPDGIFTVHKDKLIELFGNKVKDLEYDEDNETIVLLELKAPTTRIIKDDIPVYYVPQVYSGMCVIEPTVCGIFSEIVVRRCAYNQRKGLDYTSTFMKYGKPADKVVSDKVIHKGLVSIYTTDKDIHNNFRRMMNINDDMFCDFGSCTSDIFFEMIKLWRQDKLTVNYISLPNSEQIDDFNLLGVCAWKCFDMSFHFVEKKPLYVKQIWPVIELSLKAIDAVNSITDQKEKLIKLREYELNIRQLNAQLTIDY